MPETALLFLLLYILGLLLALFVSPSWGLYTYLAVFYVHPPSRWWGHMLPDVRWSLVAAAVTLIALAIYKGKTEDRPRWYQSTIAKCLILYTVWMWLQLPWVYSKFQIDGTILFTKYLMLFYLMHEILDDKDKLQSFLLLNVVGAAYFGILVVLAPDTGRLEGVGGPGLDNANSLGMHLSTILMFASFLLLSSKGWKRWLVFACLPLILNGIIQTESRGAIVGLLAGGFLTLYLKPKKIRKTYYALAAIAAVAVLGMLNQAFLERMTGAVTAVSGEAEWDGSASSRIDIAKAQLEMFKDHPLGAGHQGTTALSRQYMDASIMAKTTGYRASHNTLMSVLVDQGIVGIMIFTVLLFSAMGTIIKLKRADRNGLSLELGLYRVSVAAALVVAFGAGMFADYLKAEVQIWCLIMISLLAEFARQDQHAGARERIRPHRWAPRLQ